MFYFYTRTMVTYGSFLAFVFFLGIITENGALYKPDKKEVPMAQAHIQAQEIPEALIAKRGQFRSLFKKDPWVIDWRRIFKWAITLIETNGFHYQKNPQHICNFCRFLMYKLNATCIFIPNFWNKLKLVLNESLCIFVNSKRILTKFSLLWKMYSVFSHIIHLNSYKLMQVS